MSYVKLQYFKNICASCEAEFTTLHLPQDFYGPVLASTIEGEISFLLPDDNTVWNEVVRMLEIDSKNQWQSISESKRADLLTDVLEITLDASPTGQHYHMWGKIPCPHCGAANRAYFGPVDPPRFVNVPQKLVTHNTWNNLSRAEKEKRVVDIVDGVFLRLANKA